MAVLSAVFAFRLAFGLSRPFFYEDETQIFLLGLRYHATGQWPFFGPDVVWTRSEIPGALQALLVGVPFTILPIPEAPFVLMNVLSFAALSALAWYTCEQLPQAPRWLIWGWFLTVPWTLQFSTHVINPSYVLPAAIVFFIAFFEAMPTFTLGRLSRPAAHALMGAAIVWIMQVHMSWPLLLPFALIAWFSGRADGWKRLAVSAAACAAGALVPGLLLIPTLVRYGVLTGSGGISRNLHPHGVNPWILVTTLARLLSFASLEIARFIGTDGAKRYDFFRRHVWLVPLAAIVWAVGVIQPLWMLADAVRFSRPRVLSIAPQKWTALRRLVASSVLVVYASYWLVMEPPQAHAFYALAPLALVFAAFWWAQIDSPRARMLAGGALGLNVCFHAGLAWAQGSELSLYTNRAPVAAAIALKQPEMFAHRRDFAVDAGPYVLAANARPYDVRRDIEIMASPIAASGGPSLRWAVTVRNRNNGVAFRDLLYITTYFDDRDGVIEQRHERIKEIFEPGAVRAVDVNDGYANLTFTRARLEVVAAEALLPAAAPMTTAVAK
jgi:hypothetical protein